MQKIKFCTLIFSDIEKNDILQKLKLITQIVEMKESKRKNANSFTAIENCNMLSFQQWLQQGKGFDSHLAMT